jgi:hypothetical protein
MAERVPHWLETPGWRHARYRAWLEPAARALVAAGLLWPLSGPDHVVVIHKGITPGSSIAYLARTIAAELDARASCPRKDLPWEAVWADLEATAQRMPPRRFFHG